MKATYENLKPYEVLRRCVYNVLLSCSYGTVNQNAATLIGNKQRFRFSEDDGDDKCLPTNAVRINDRILQWSYNMLETGARASVCHISELSTTHWFIKCAPGLLGVIDTE
jgi:hypothetical protein